MSCKKDSIDEVLLSNPCYNKDIMEDEKPLNYWLVIISSLLLLEGQNFKQQNLNLLIGQKRDYQSLLELKRGKKNCSCAINMLFAKEQQMLKPTYFFVVKKVWRN